MRKRRLYGKTKRTCLAVSAIAGALCADPGLLCGQTNDTFTNAAGTGFWNNSGNWSAGLPGVSSNVLITGSGSAASVTQDVSATINNLTLNSGNTWSLKNGLVLTVGGNTISNAGKMNMNSTGNFTELLIGSASVTLSGGGTLTMSNNANNFIFGAATADTLTNKETIQGAGNIGDGRMTLVNSGTINANQSAGLTIQANGGTTNTGLLEATAGAALTFNGTTVTNTGGTVTANTGTLKLINTTINGGTVSLVGSSLLQLTNGIVHSGSTLTNSTTGTIEALAGASTLGGTINNAGLLKIDNGAVLNLENGSYPSLGKVTLNSTGNFTELIVNGANVTLSGGSITMSNNPNNFIFGAATADTLTNKETIQGAGNIGDARMTLVNSGTINANQSAGLTIQANGGTTNTGLLEATAGAALTFNGTTVTNTGGTVTANTGSLKLINTTINGGTVSLAGASLLQLTNGIVHSSSTLTNSTTGTIEALAGTNTLGGTINNAGLLKIDNGAVLNLENGSYPSLGKVTLNSTGNFTELIVNGAGVTLSGGSVTMSNNPNNFIFGAATTDTLTNKETIQGSGNIGDARMTLVNSGTIIANQSNPLFIDASGPFTNNGTLQVGSGDLLHVEGGAFTNFSGTTLTGGTYNTSGTLQINQLGTAGGEIVTNSAAIILNGTSSSFVDSAGKDALSKLAVNAGGSNFTITNGRNFTTAGNFSNSGTLGVGGGSTFSVTGALSNFSGTTLNGGIYNVSGTLQFPGANIVTNAANIALIGTSSRILNSTTSANALANLAANASSGTFSVQGGRTFTTLGSFSNAGTFLIGTGSAFTLGGGGFTQTAGKTTDDGTLAVPSTGTVNLTGGSLFGTGAITGAVTSAAAVTPGDSSTTTGVLKDTGAYTQKTTGSLNIAINGTTAGTQYSQLNPSTATLSGTLNITRPTSFVPTVGSTFKILNFSSATGQFSTVNGLAINSTEHFTITYQPTDVLLSVVSGASSSAAQLTSSSRVRSGFGGGEADRPGLQSYARNGLLTPRGSGSQIARDSVLTSKILLASRVLPAPRPVTTFNRVQSPGLRSAAPAQVTARVNPAASSAKGQARGNGIGYSVLEYHLNVLSLFEKSSRHSWRDLLRQPGDPNAPTFGNLTFSGSR
jgi:hypothetical protein